MSLFKRFRKFDVYTKPIEDCRVKTSFGGLSKLRIFLTFYIINFSHFNKLYGYYYFIHH